MASVDETAFFVDGGETFWSSQASRLMSNDTSPSILYLALSADYAVHLNFGEKNKNLNLKAQGGKSSTQT